MRRTEVSEAHDLQDLVARALFQDKFPMRSWSRSRGFMQANARLRAMTALKRAGIENVSIKTVVNQKENRHHGDELV